MKAATRGFTHIVLKSERDPRIYIYKYAIPLIRRAGISFVCVCVRGMELRLA